MYVTIFLLLISKISGTLIPYIKDVYLEASTQPNLITTVLFNRSCQECLCQEVILNNTNNLALNCFQNGTCQFFQTFPLSYAVKSSPGNQLYFLQGIFPNASICCISNITEILTRLQNAVPVTMNLTFQPAAFGYDRSAGSGEAAVNGWDLPIIYWFDPFTMEYIKNSTGNASLSLTLYDNLTFTALDGTPIVYLRDTHTNDYMGKISYPSLEQVRKIIFINNGETAIFSTPYNNTLTFFTVNVSSPLNYTFQQQIPVPVQGVHGIASLTSKSIYVSSWNSRTILSYNYTHLGWTPTVFVNYTVTGNGSHLTTDACNRVWYINTSFGVRIYDSTGVEIGTWNMSLSSSDQIYDILLLSNYIVLISHYQKGKVVQYNPQVTCA